MNKLLVSAAPFKKQSGFVYLTSLIWILCLLPVLIAGLVFNQVTAVLTFCAAFFTYITLEMMYIIATKQLFFINIFKAIPTAMIIGMLMPPNVAIYIPIVCACVSFIFKVFFGDDNGMVVNKSAIGIVFVIAVLGIGVFNEGFWGITPNEILRSDIYQKLKVDDLLFGNGVNGFIGTTCVGLIFISGIVLCCLRVVNFRVPIMAVLAFCLTVYIVKDKTSILPELMSGGVVFVMFFVATEYFTCPNNGASGYIYGIILGVVMAVFKLKLSILGEYAVLYALLICNLFVAFIDKWHPKYFGEGRNSAKISV